jgi:hypothetical protein
MPSEAELDLQRPRTGGRASYPLVAIKEPAATERHTQHAVLPASGQVEFAPMLGMYLAVPVRCVRRRRLREQAGRLGRAILHTTLHIVRKPEDQRGFAVIPHRWTVERTLSWLTAHRRLAATTNATP